MKKSPIALRIISLILLIGWMGLIFYFSHQNSGTSSNMSAGLIRRVLQVFIPETSGDELTNVIASLQFIVRKTEHLTLYLILGAFALLHFSTYNRFTLIVKLSSSLVLSVLYAVSDEYHQTYIQGRSGEIRDVIIDSVGAIIGILLSLLIYKIFKTIKNKSVSKV
jgi:VanZ family protein